MTSTIKYHSITGSKSTVARQLLQHFSNEIVGIQEKVHGANMRITYKSGTITFSSRNRDLANDDNFNGLNIIRSNLVECVEKLAPMVKSGHFQIIGEICGGKYPNIQSKVKSVQPEEVYYTPNIAFLPFDLQIDEAFCAWSTAYEMLKQAGFIPLPTLATFKLGDFATFDPDSFVSTIPEMLGYPRIETNIAEGIVIKTDVPMFTPRGNRCIIKIKSRKFLEDSGGKIPNSSSVVKGLDPKVVEIITDISPLVCRQRLENVLSKDTYDLPKETMTVGWLLVNDAIKEYLENDSSAELGKNRKVIEKALLKIALPLVRTM